MLLATFALALALSGRVVAQSTDASPCAVGCVDGAFANTASLGCGTGDRLCMCGQTTGLTDGISSCITQACASEADVQIPLAESYGTALCSAASSSAGLLSTTSTATTASATQPTTTEAAATTTAATETTAAADASGSVFAQTAAETTDPTTTAGTTLATSASTTAASASSSTTTSGASGVAAAATTASSAASSDNGDDNTNTESSSSGLSIAAKAGIAAGAGVAVIMAVIIAICTRLRSKQRSKDARRAHALQISQPMPGSGRQYAPEVRTTHAGLSRLFNARMSDAKRGWSVQSPTSVYSRSSAGVDLEHHARAYEDTLPRTQPRAMI